MTGGLRLDPAWLVAAVPRGVVCVLGSTEIELGFEASLDERVALVEALAERPSLESVAGAVGAEPEQAREVIETLRDRGVLVDSDAPEAEEPAEGLALAEAILRVAEDEAVEVAWTATEVLVLPPDVPAPVARRAVRAFVAGLRPHGRLEGHCETARLRRRVVAGDRPAAGALREAVERARDADPEQVHVAEIGGDGLASLPVEDVGRIGVERPHRLGPLRRVAELAAGPPLAGRRFSFVAEYAVPNLRFPLRREVRVGRGTTASREESELVARAEAAERYAAGDVDPGALRLARADELPDRVDAGELHRLTERQYADHRMLRPAEEGEELLWIAGRTPGGAERWVPADAVFLVNPDPVREPLLGGSSSGLAAGRDLADATDRALHELIERDAFMWTWVQRVARERIGRASLPEEAADLADAIEEVGFGVSLVNLTLDTKPVILAAAHREDRLHVAASCREDPAAAAAKALNEIGLVVSINAQRGAPDLEPQDVVTPEDHMWLHQRAEMASRAGFLLGGDDEIDLREVAAAPGPVAEAVMVVGEPVVIDLTSPRTAPFSVVRALVPGFVPITFGWDREPLGMPRVAAPVSTAGGLTIGTHLSLEGAPPIIPHPFP